MTRTSGRCLPTLIRAWSPLIAVTTSKPIRTHRSATAPRTRGSSSTMSILGAALLDSVRSITHISNVAFRLFPS